MTQKLIVNSRVGWRVKIILLLASMMTMMAGAIIAPALPQIRHVFQTVPHAELLSKLILTLPALVIAFCGPFFGTLVNLYGRKKILLFSLVLYFVAGTSGAYLENLVLILVGRGLLGVAVSGIMVSVTTLIADLMQDQERNSFMGLQGAFMGIGGMLFIGMAGILTEGSWHYPFWIYCTSLPVALLALYGLREPGGENREEQSAQSQLPLVNASKYQVYGVFLLVFFSIVLFYMVPTQIPFLLENIPDVSKSEVGMVMAIFTFFQALGSLSYKYIKKVSSFSGMYGWGFFLMALGYLWLGQTSSFISVIYALMLAGLGSGLVMPNGNLWIMALSGKAELGQRIGQLTTFTYLGQFFSPVIFQPLVEKGGISPVFSMVGSFLFVGSFVFLAISFLWMKREFIFSR